MLRDEFGSVLGQPLELGVAEFSLDAQNACLTFALNGRKPPMALRTGAGIATATESTRSPP